MFMKLMVNEAIAHIIFCEDRITAPINYTRNDGSYFAKFYKNCQEMELQLDVVHQIKLSLNRLMKIPL